MEAQYDVAKTDTPEGELPSLARMLGEESELLSKSLHQLRSRLVAVRRESDANKMASPLVAVPESRSPLGQTLSESLKSMRDSNQFISELIQEVAL